MSLYDYQQSQRIVIERSAERPTFAALIMQAARKADSANFARLEQEFPEIIAELQARYDAPGGRLESD
jgi:hypothetical protein